MKKIIITICLLLVSVFAVTRFYFKNISSSENSIEKVFKTIPSDASIIFEYKNENSFYEIFKDFNLFEALLGKSNITHLSALKNIFVNDLNFKSYLSENELYFSLHKTSKNKSDLLILTPINKEQNISDLVTHLKNTYQLEEKAINNHTVYKISFSNDSKFHFTVFNNLLIGSYEEELIKNTLSKSDKAEKNLSNFKNNLSEVRNKNSIANLYINYSNLHGLLSNFSNKTNPSETFPLKSFQAFSSLNINYQSNAFMFSGITEVKNNKKGYVNLFLNQNPGKSTLINILPYDAASHMFYYVSDVPQFIKNLHELFIERNEIEKRKTQLQNISQTHTVNLEKEFPLVLGNEFGTISLASGDKIGIVKSKNIKQLSFLLSTISTEISEGIGRLNNSNVLYYYLGDPFKVFTRPFYAVIENHLVVSNNQNALKRFLKDYETQHFLSRTDRNLEFQQYLSNQGNIFYFIHNGNSKGIIRSYLSKEAYNNSNSEQFDWKNIYGFSIQFSADKDKFFTNLYMSKIPDEIKLPVITDSLIMQTIVTP